MHKAFRLLLQLAGDDSATRVTLESFYYHLRLLARREKTVKCYAERLSYLLTYAHRLDRPLLDLTAEEIQAYLYSLVDHVSPETVNGRIRVYKRFYHWAVEEEYIAESPCRRIKLLRVEHTIKDLITPEQLKLVLDVCPPDFTGQRNRAVMVTMYDAILRPSEICRLHLADAQLHERTIILRGTKTHQDRYAPLSAQSAVILLKYVRKSRTGLPGPFLFPLRDGRQMDPHHLTTIFDRLSRASGVKVYPYLLRHSGATEYLRQGGNPLLLQRILGHATANTTNLYVHLCKDDLIDAHRYHSPLGDIKL